ncbi:DUF4386 domain-containing protein [Blastococcus tunisiensis]|uniref:DUF4386 domain-containing protein n=1 Tax=Blastococcus tunisiensis TaxID=1798228 RepID=A0A1I2H3W5_9ACTN|nr:DUF4386 domain-containing protein [Blastococcus sp. DSM 46838]SFF24029.1 protein of unknown function [Blastococcus sp. DSM 46838]
MIDSRRTATVTGVFFLVAAFPAMAALALYQPVLGDGSYVLGTGSDAGIRLGAFLEILVAVSVAGTAITLYPVLRHRHSGFALGYVCGRLLEATLIVIGILALLAVLTLRDGVAGADDGALVATGRALVALHDWTFLFGPNVALGVNTVLLAWLLLRSGLVPRWIPALGLVAGPLIFVSATAVLAGLYDQVSLPGTLAALPVFAWEMSLAVYLVARGFRGAVPASTPAVERGAPVPA